MSSSDRSTIVIGLGNVLLSDDGAGPHVVDALKAVQKGGGVVELNNVVLEQDSHGGLRLMERLMDYKRAIIVDAIVTGAEAGTIFELSLGDMPTAHSASTHDMTLPTALAFGRASGAEVPEDDAIRLIGIEAADVLTFQEACTEKVAAVIPDAANHVRSLLREAPHWVPARGRI